MLRTITVGSSVSIQGLLVGELPDGKVKIMVDNKTYVGIAITAQPRLS